MILRDGTTLCLRAPRREDSEPLLAFFRGLSERSLYLRFHGIRHVDDRLIEPVLDPRLGGTWCAARYGRRRLRRAGRRPCQLRPPARSRCGGGCFSVADAFQRRGIGTRLLEQLARRAAAHGIERFLAEVMSDNRGMLRVFEAIGFELTRERAGGEMEVEFPITATEELRGTRCRARSRGCDRVATSVLRPARRSGDGASSRRGSIGGELFRNILESDFVGATYPVNRDGTPVAGVHAYRSINDIAEPIDLAVICLPGADVLDAAENALRRGVRALVVISAGFAEVGSEGIERQEQLLSLVRSHGARLIGPNCLGIAIAGPSLQRNVRRRAAPPGNIGFSSQSGALGLAFLEAAVTRGLGLSAFVSSATRQTCRRTICSSGGRTTRRRPRSCSTSSRLGIRAASAVLSKGRPDKSRYSRSRAGVCEWSARR